MLKSFISFCNRNKWNLKVETTLLAVSGGVDSMVLLHLFIQAKFPVAVAHINFGLRGTESNLDEELVRNTCEKHNIPLHVFSPETEDFAKTHHLSIQMAARQLRYDFFDELCQTFLYQKLATAHHSDDNMEHFFIYLLRNSPKTALKGIPVQNNNIIRPMLGFTRNQIVEYARAENIEWRNDASNDSVKYLRNKVRHLLIPQLKEVYPEIEKDFYFLSAGMNNFFDKQLKEDSEAVKKYIVKSNAAEIEISKEISNTADGQRRFVDFAKKLGFEAKSATQMLTANTGSVLQASKSGWQMQILSERIRFVSEQATESNVMLNLKDIGTLQTIEVGQFVVELSVQTKMAKTELNEWYFELGDDAGELNFRQATTGERMSIWGMKGTQKISDVYTNAKISRFERHKYPVLELDGVVLGVLGVRRSAEMPALASGNKLLKVQWRMMDAG